MALILRQKPRHLNPQNHQIRVRAPLRCRLTIIRAIVGLATAKRLKITAEGVETPEQMEFLRDVGCDELQGFLLSRPLPAEEVDVLLRHPRKVASR